MTFQEVWEACQEETRIDLDTVAQNRKRGAVKGAETRRAKKVAAQSNCHSVDDTSRAASAIKSSTNTEESGETYCGSCGKLYVEEADEIELWVGCDLCAEWFCGHCKHFS